MYGGEVVSEDKPKALLFDWCKGERLEGVAVFHPIVEGFHKVYTTSIEKEDGCSYAETKNTHYRLMQTPLRKVLAKLWEDPDVRKKIEAVLLTID